MIPKGIVNKIYQTPFIMNESSWMRYFIAKTTISMRIVCCRFPKIINETSGVRLGIYMACSRREVVVNGNASKIKMEKINVITGMMISYLRPVRPLRINPSIGSVSSYDHCTPWFVALSKDSLMFLFWASLKLCLSTSQKDSSKCFSSIVNSKAKTFSSAFPSWGWSMSNSTKSL